MKKSFVIQLFPFGLPALFSGMLLLFSWACKESYDAPVKSTRNAYLVVDGFINNGTDSTYVHLTHTFTLDDSSRVTPELRAKVTVEGKSNGSYSLQEWGGGVYGIPSLALNTAQPYRLHILTAAGKEYVSDYLELKTSPPIDSISWQRTAAGNVQIYANTHDPQNASHYYRWEYQETWEFNSAYYAILKYVNHKIAPLFPNPYYTCWKYASSTSILLGSSTKLSTDEISQAPLALIPSGSWKLQIRYSILVRQYVLTADAYNFWQQMQKNTEQIGSIFSPQPSEPKGNVHSLKDPTEQVIGFVSAGTFRQQRIFITPGQIPDWHSDPYFTCSLLDIPEDSLEYYLGGSSFILPVDYSPTSSGQGPPRYDIADAYCVNCTLTGTNIKPSYWP
jgi:hypothetical protein